MKLIYGQDRIAKATPLFMEGLSKLGLNPLSTFHISTLIVHKEDTYYLVKTYSSDDIKNIDFAEYTVEQYKNFSPHQLRFKHVIINLNEDEEKLIKIKSSITYKQ